MAGGGVRVVCTVDAGELADAWGKLLADRIEEAHRVILRAGYRVRNESLRLVPVDTGRLKSSLTVAQEADGDGFWVVVGTNVSYAVHVEYGTARAKAQPFLRPAVDAERDRLISELKSLFQGV